MTMNEIISLFDVNSLKYMLQFYKVSEVFCFVSAHPRTTLIIIII